MKTYRTGGLEKSTGPVALPEMLNNYQTSRHLSYTDHYLIE